jgi:hypothetical protein
MNDGFLLGATTYKQHIGGGWEAQTRLPLNATDIGIRYFVFRTLPTRSGLKTLCHCCVKLDDERDHFTADDYSRLVVSHPPSTASRKDVEDMHQAALLDFDDVITEAKLFYGILPTDHLKT